MKSEECDPAIMIRWAIIITATGINPVGYIHIFHYITQFLAFQKNEGATIVLEKVAFTFTLQI